MPVFHVYLNNKKVSSAGVGDKGVLGAHVTWVRRRTEVDTKKPGLIEELNLHVGGLITGSEEHVGWMDRKLKIGDEIRIVIAGKGGIDKPRSRKKIDRAQELQAQKRYVKDMAKKLGWKIQTRP